MSTLARFITVRNPRKPTRDELEGGFIHYDHAGPSSKLIPTEERARRERTRREPSRDAIRAYKNTAEYIDSMKDLERRPALMRWIEWLEVENVRLTSEALIDFKRANPLDVDDELRALLWDNLLAHGQGGSPLLRESLVWGIRAIKLAELEGEHSDASLRRRATATIVLPGESQSREPERPSGRGGPEPSPSAPANPRADALRYAERLRSASEDLQRAYLAQLEQQRAKDIPELYVPRVGVAAPVQTPHMASPEKGDSQQRSGASTPHAGAEEKFEASVRQRLDGETLKLLDELKVEPTARIPVVLQRLDQEASSTARTAMHGVRAVRKLAKVGGALWTHAAGGATAPPGFPPQGVPIAGPAPAPAAGPPPATHVHGFKDDVSECRVRALGVADFRRIEQRLCCYEPGEVAHIENVLIGESKERKTRRLQRTEETVTVMTEEEEVRERDTQTTDRFELEKETEKEIEQSLQFEVGVNVAASYGPVQITANSRFAVSSSSRESDREAARYAREVTERAAEKITTKKREERVTKRTAEFEEHNSHVLENASGSQHIVGLYRWVDKVYEAWIVNYGKRLMFEFMIPEPAAFHLHAMTKEPIESTLTIEKPIDPRSEELFSEIGLLPLRSHESITVSNYGFYAAAYEANVSAPPPALLTVGKAFHREGLNHDTQFSDSKVDLTLQPGYEAERFTSVYGLHSEGDNWITIAIGRQSRFTSSGGTFSAVLHGEDDLVPVIVMGKTRMYALNVEVECRRTEKALDDWQIRTFNAILDAYTNKLADYNNALAEARSGVGILIPGANPGRNRMTERTELQKGAIRLLAQNCSPLWSDAMRDEQECGYPEFDCCEAISDGEYVQFVEQAFEWPLVTYRFYPYFWGRKCNWKLIYQLEDPDPLFLAFLQAGYARVVVPVRPGYENAVLRFVADGTLWDGGAVPTIDDPLYVSLINEMKEPVGEIDDSVEPWRIKLPTQLVALQCESGCIPGAGLPCPCEEEDGGPTPS